MPAMGSTLGKGLAFLLNRDGRDDRCTRHRRWPRLLRVGLRDEGLNAEVGKAMMAGPAPWQAVKRLRRDRMTASLCWFHAATCCLSKVNRLCNAEGFSVEPRVRVDRS